MTTRRKLTFAAGLVAFLIGTGATYLSLRGGASEASGRTVLYAAQPIPPGTTGAAAVNAGMVKTRPVAARAAPPSALVDVSELAGKTAAVAIAPGQILTADLFPPAQTRIGTLRIPEGKTALALEMRSVAGVAGFAGAGDKIDVYGVVAESAPGRGAEVRLLLQGVEVLNVNGAALATSAGQPGATGLVFLLAVSPPDAERLVYLSTFEQLYFALVPKDHTPVPSTPGFGAGDGLRL